MNQNLDNYLVEKYPKIFVNRYADMKTTAMVWGFDHEDGWFWILDQLCDSIQNYIDYNYHKNISQVIADQVKEKFGTLSFYYHGGDDYIDGMVRLAENMSANVCEFCGSTKNVGRTKGWISTICKECYSSSEGRISQRPWEENQNIKELRKFKIKQINKKL